MKKPTFSVNQYDYEGDVVSRQIYLHLGDTILAFDSVDEMEAFADAVKKMLPEVRENVEYLP